MAYTTAALSLVATAAAAKMQNDSVRRSMRSAQQAAKVQAVQVNKQAKVESLKATVETEKVRGRIRVAAAAAGIPIEGSSYESLLNQSDYNDAFNQSIIEENRKANVARVVSGGQANMAELSSRFQNVLIAGFQGGLSGLSAGLAIEGMMKERNKANTLLPDGGDPGLKIGGTGDNSLPSYGGGPFA